MAPYTPSSAKGLWLPILTLVWNESLGKEEMVERFAVADVCWSSTAIQHRRVVIDAQQVEDCCREFLRTNTTGVGIGAVGIAGPINLTAGDARPGQR